MSDLLFISIFISIFGHWNTGIGIQNPAGYSASSDIGIRPNRYPISSFIRFAEYSAGG
jgi:hypothetical protein